MLVRVPEILRFFGVVSLEIRAEVIHDDVGVGVRFQEEVRVPEVVLKHVAPSRPGLGGDVIATRGNPQPHRGESPVLRAAHVESDVTAFAPRGLHVTSAVLQVFLVCHDPAQDSNLSAAAALLISGQA